MSFLYILCDCRTLSTYCKATQWWSNCHSSSTSVGYVIWIRSHKCWQNSYSSELQMLCGWKVDIKRSLQPYHNFPLGQLINLSLVPSSLVPESVFLIFFSACDQKLDRWIYIDGKQRLKTILIGEFDPLNRKKFAHCQIFSSQKTNARLNDQKVSKYSDFLLRIQ